jgi:sterol desaturase/sphingolipid hydroxylase (fatty acid hydroxylase superfamily)
VSRAIVLAAPVFLALIALEVAWGRRTGRNTYGLADAMSSIALGIMSQYTAVFTRLLRVGVYAAAAASLSLVPAEAAAAFWTSPLGWVLALVSYDLCYYWLHRAGHESAIFWAAHVVHHQSRHYNLSTALRQTSSGALLGWVFYLPMAVIGIPTEVFAVAAVVNLLYQYWIHTEQIGKLGWFDRWFGSPSNHRVHHAVNDCYIDRNYGGITMAWDRLFGTFVEEREKCVYGTRAPLDSWDPLWANFEVYADLARRSWQAPRWRDKFAVWFMPPGWVPALAGGPAWQKSSFDLGRVRRYDPPLQPGARAFTLVHFAAVLVGATTLLWYSSELPLTLLAAAAVAVLGVLWLIGAVMQGRLAPGRALLIEVGTALLLAAALAAGGLQVG